MKHLGQIIEISTYDKVKALYDRPGTPGEKAAAKAAMDRIRPNKPKPSNLEKTEDDFDMESGHRDVLKHHGFSPMKVKPQFQNNWEVHRKDNIDVNLRKHPNGNIHSWTIQSPKYRGSGMMADTLFSGIVMAKYKNSI